MVYCLRSFVQILEEVLHPDQHHKKWLLDHDKIPQVQSLWETACFLRDFLDELSPLVQHRFTNLEDQIMDAAEMAEDTIETYLTGEILSNPEGQAFMISPPNLGEAIQAFEDAKKEVIKIMDACERPDDNVSPPVSSTSYPNHNNVVVGVTEDLEQLRSWLQSRVSELVKISIVGMGGMGKTTLAKMLYDQFSSSKSYDCFAWVTVSQSFDQKLSLRTLLASATRKPLDEISDTHTTYELIEALYKTLIGRRYLIVVDDIWSSKAWDGVQTAFPKENKGSRIILTTRENVVADYVDSKCHEMHFLNMDDSWEILRRKVFGEESCPRELEEVGKSIARSCGGLPLALQVIGGLLSTSDIRIDFWEHVSNNITSSITKTDDQFSRIFYWSFAYLPHYLKPCFLYMAGISDNWWIRASTISKLWVSEGFVYPIRGKSLEEAARIHLNALVDRNLIFVRQRGKSGKAKAFGIHDLLRDLCLKKAQEKKFLYFKALQTDNHLEDGLCLGRIVMFHIHDNPPILMPLNRSFRCLEGFPSYASEDLSRFYSKLSLLRVLDLSSGSYLGEFPEVILQLVNLRYLHININDFIPLRISVLRNLQTLIVHEVSSVALILFLPQLRHLKFYRVSKYSELMAEFYELPPYGVHENLQSLSGIEAKEVTKLLGKLPNLRKLSINCENDEEFIDLASFHMLEILDLYCRKGQFERRNGFSLSLNMTFPVSLKKISLSNCKISESYLNTIAALPNLQILIIGPCKGKMDWDWESCEGGFCALKYLKITWCHLTTLLASEVHFPVLERLVFIGCYYLIEIPDYFGCIETLEIIEVDYSVYRRSLSQPGEYTSISPSLATLMTFNFGLGLILMNAENDGKR